MVESNHDEERLARVERMLAQCQHEAAALRAMAASKVVVIVVEAAPPLGAKHAYAATAITNGRHGGRAREPQKKP